MIWCITYPTTNYWQPNPTDDQQAQQYRVIHDSYLISERYKSERNVGTTDFQSKLITNEITWSGRPDVTFGGRERVTMISDVGEREGATERLRSTAMDRPNKGEISPPRNLMSPPSLRNLVHAVHSFDYIPRSVDRWQNGSRLCLTCLRSSHRLSC